MSLDGKVRDSIASIIHYVSEKCKYILRDFAGIFLQMVAAHFFLVGINDNYRYDRARIVALEQLRHDYVHHSGLGVRLPQGEADLSFFCTRQTTS